MTSNDKVCMALKIFFLLFARQVRFLRQTLFNVQIILNASYHKKQHPKQNLILYIHNYFYIGYLINDKLIDNRYLLLINNFSI